MNLTKHNKTSGLEKLLRQRDSQCAELQRENAQLRESLSKQEEAVAKIKVQFQLAENTLKHCAEEYTAIKAKYQELLKYADKASKEYVSELKALLKNHKV